MPDKYVGLNSGELVEVEATDSSAGVGDAGEVVALDSAGLIDQSMMPVGVGPDTQEIVASEDLSAGALVNKWNDGGTVKVRKADASNGYEAHGFVLSAFLSAATALVYFEGRITGLSGLTPAANQYLSDTAGETTETPVTTSGYMSQRVGSATDATTMNFEPQRTVIIA